MVTLQEVPGLAVRPLEGPGDLAEALALNARVYADRGIVASVDDDYLDDRWIRRSTYFGAFHDGAIVGTARLIPYAADMHVFEMFDIEQDWMDRLQDVPLEGNAFEVSALSVPKDAPGGFFAVSGALYRGMLQYSLVQRRFLWFAILTPMLARILNRILGVPLQVIGPRVDVMGAVRMPAIIDLVTFLHHIREHHPEQFAYALRGLEIDLTTVPEPWFDTTGDLTFGTRR